ncbi:ATP-dependent Zn protease [filamentous cyanobacterium CCP5]|nr:ATP-dependent Zn protease [filamentous cyanobacterium CCP5]
MRDTTLNLVAISIFSVTMLALVGPMVELSPAIPAGLIVGLLGAATLDQLGLNGRVGNILLDWLAWTSPEHRQRVIHHEAGHFLVATLLDIPVQDYTLSTWQAWKRGLPGQGGVVFDIASLGDELQSGVSAQTINRYSQVWMAGIAAEQLLYGASTGGNDDCQKLRVLWQALGRSPESAQVQQRWAILQAKTLLENHQNAYQGLCEAMAKAAPVVDCQALLANQIEAPSVAAREAPSQG